MREQPTFLGHEADPAVFAGVEHELTREQTQIELIASENIVSAAVMQAQGSVLTNKYAEGYPGKRYYGGCEYVDIAEQLAIDRVKQLFGADYAARGERFRTSVGILTGEADSALQPGLRLLPATPPPPLLVAGLALAAGWGWRSSGLVGVGLSLAGIVALGLACPVVRVFVHAVA